MASTGVGNQYGFFAPQGTTLNVVFSFDGTNPPPAVSGVFNLEVITSPTGVSYTLPSGYQGLALLPGGTGQTLNLLLGNINVADSGSSDSIIGGSGKSSIGGAGGGTNTRGGGGRKRTIGGVAGDTISGGTGNELIDGPKGNQSINGGGIGNETIYGGAGDTIKGGGATATIGGGAGGTENR